MTLAAVAASRSLAFGSIADGIWGAAWLGSDGESGPIVLGTQAAADPVVASVEGHGSEESWRVVAEGVELSVSPVGAASEHPEDGFDQLARVEGRIALDDAEHSLSCLGWRAAHTEQLATGRVDSFRQVAAWFEPGEGVALLALRPRSARGQEGDQMTAAVLDLESSVSVADPRLSTTYSGEGQPFRAGLELWVGEEEQQYPHRAAGEAVGQPAAWSVGTIDLHAQLFSWHSRGQAGAGVYLIGTVR